MKRTLFIVALALAGAIDAQGTIPVVDYSHIAQDAGNEIVNFVKWAGTQVTSAATELNTLNTYENEVLQLARMGDPAALRALPGVQNIATLEAIYGQVQKDATDINQLANPANAKTNLNEILSNYKLPQWNGINNGSAQFPLVQSNYQFPVSNYNVAQTVQQKLQALTTTLTSLTQQRDQALQSLQSATNQSAVAKYHAIIDGLNGALADVHEQMTQTMHLGQLAQSQNDAAKQIQQQAQKEQNAASFQQGVNGTLQTIGSAGSSFGTTPRWSDIQQ